MANVKIATLEIVRLSRENTPYDGTYWWLTYRTPRGVEREAGGRTMQEALDAAADEEER